MDKLKVIFACGRDNFRNNIAGDTIQILKTKEKLNEIGVRVNIIDKPSELYNKKDFDVLHVFNLPFSKRSLQYIKIGKRLGLKIVITPIYWDFSHSIFVPVQKIVYFL